MCSCLCTHTYVSHVWMALVDIEFYNYLICEKYTASDAIGISPFTLCKISSSYYVLTIQEKWYGFDTKQASDWDMNGLAQLCFFSLVAS